VRWRFGWAALLGADGETPGRRSARAHHSRDGRFNVRNGHPWRESAQQDNPPHLLEVRVADLVRIKVEWLLALG